MSYVIQAAGQGCVLAQQRLNPCLGEMPVVSQCGRQSLVFHNETVLNGLGDVLGFDHGCAVEIGDGAGDLEDVVFLNRKIFTCYDKESYSYCRDGW